MLKERIPKEWIKEALDKGFITFGMECDNLVACIAESWFYICSDYGKTENDFTNEQLVDMIYKTVNDEPINDDDDDVAYECNYYRGWLATFLEKE